MTTPERDRATGRLSNPNSRSAEPSGARSATAPIAIQPREPAILGAHKIPLQRGRRTRPPKTFRSRGRFLPQVGLLEQRALLSALPTLTALSASTASASLGQSVTFTATVSDLSPGGATPNGGTVTFSDHNGAIDSETLVDGVAAFTTSSLPVGTGPFTASYGGTSDFAPSATGTIVTVAGNGTGGYAGNNGPATAAELDNPHDLAFDSAGNLFISDYGNNVVREVVKATGDIITVAGNGIGGNSGNNGPATAAELNGPRDITVDSAGNLFIADSNNNVIREVVKATGDIIRIAGNGTAGYSGDNGRATDAELDNPRGLAFDSAGNLLFADTFNNVIREVVAATDDIITVAGDGNAGYSGNNGPAAAAELNSPIGLAFDSAGDLFIADYGNNVVREIVEGTGEIIAVAGNGTAGDSGNNGPATAAELNGPIGLAFDSAGDLFLADQYNNVVQEVVKATDDIIAIAGNGTAGYSGNKGPAAAAELDQPLRVAVDSAGDLFVTDSLNNVVRELTTAVTVTISPTPTPTPTPTTTPTLTALTASTASGPAGQSVTFTATVSDLSPGGAAPDDGTVTFSDQSGPLDTANVINGVVTFTTANLTASTVTITASYGGTSDFTPSATGTIVTAAGNGTAGYTGDNGPATDAELDGVGGLAVDSAGDLFISDTKNNVIREVVKATGDIITVAGNGTDGYSGDNGPATAAELDTPQGIAVDSAGDLFIGDTGNNRIREVLKATGDIITFAGNGTAGYSGDNGPATAAELSGAPGLAVDSVGNLFIADLGNNRIREVRIATGHIITVAGNGTAGSSGDNGPATDAELNGPNGVAVDSAGDLFIVEANNNVVQEVVKATGQIIAFAGNGAAGYSGDNGPAADAQLDSPLGVGVDSVGDLFIGDRFNYVVREVVKATGEIITVAGDGTDGYSGDNGPATAAELVNPARAAVDSAGDLFIGDNPDNVVREITAPVTVTISQATTSTAATSISATFSPASQTIALGATVTSAAGAVNEGTETFTMLSGMTQVGSAVNVNVENGTANANYVLPAATSTGTYTIQAVYNGTVDFLGSNDMSHSLTVSQATTATAATSISATFSPASQTIALGTTVTSAAGAVNEGTETFTILSGVTAIGSAVTVNVANGAASANYVLPAATSTGTYTIHAVYNGTADFLGSNDTSHSLTVSQATTATAAASTSATFSPASQTVPLSATVTSAAGTVNEGTETFTILSGTTAIGSAVTVNVSNGTASASYVLPAATSTGTFTIQAVYNGTADFVGSTDTSHTLTVSQATTATAAASTSATFSPASQTVSLSATVTSAAGAVNVGTETFTILSGTTVIGLAVTVNVGNRTASANYVLPAATSTGTYIIQAVYNGTADFVGSTDQSHSLTVSQATTATAAASTSATFSPAIQTVLLSATVTSAAGTVNEGTETFTILRGTTVIGSAVTVNVGNGTASANYVLPAASSTGTYAIQAVYNGTANFPGSTDTSHSLTINPSAAYQVVFGQQPANAVAGVAIGPAVMVEVEDQYHNVVTTDSSTVTLTLSSGTFEGGSSTVTAVASSGVATFSGLKIDLAGTYTLSATDATLAPSGASDRFTISPAAAHRVVFVKQPTDAVAGVAISPAVMVKVEDQYHNVVTTDSSSVTLTLSSGTFEGGASTVSAVVSSGVATFSGLKIDLAGAYTLSATDPTLAPSGASDRFTIAAARTSPAPTVIIEEPTITQKRNKKGKPTGKPVFSGFKLQFSTTMNPSTAGSSANYHVFSKVIKPGKKKSVTSLKPVNFTTSYNPATDTVTLNVKSSQPFAKGGEITISGVTDQAGALLNTSDALFIISPKAKSVTPG